MRALAVLALLGLALAQPPALPERAFVHIWQQQGERWVRQCSGFAIGVKLVYTAGHCINDRKAAYAVSLPSAPQQRYPVRVSGVRYWWPKSDQALLSLEEGDLNLQPLYRCASLPTPGETVYSLAGPLGMQPLWFVGTYGGVVGFVDQAGVQATYGGMHYVASAGAKGASGSPWLRASGCYWGLWVGQWGEQGLSLPGALVIPPL